MYHRALVEKCSPSHARHDSFHCGGIAIHADNACTNSNLLYFALDQYQVVVVHKLVDAEVMDHFEIIQVKNFTLYSLHLLGY